MKLSPTAYELALFFLKPYDTIQISKSFDKNMLWKNMERMSLWMDEYGSVPISGWPSRKDCPSDGGSVKTSWPTKPSTFENSPICNAIFVHEKFTTT